MSKVKSVLSFLWQLPQNTLAIFLYAFLRLRGAVALVTPHNGAYIIFSDAHFGVSLGWFIFLNKSDAEIHVRHEYGHCRQSRLLGPLYLFVVGIPSLSHNLWFRNQNLPNRMYYTWYCEAWADKLGGVDFSERLPRIIPTGADV